MAELMQSYPGVLCIRCRQPIAVSAKVARRKIELESEATDGPRAFITRCKQCEGEGVYAFSEIRTFEGAPRIRTAMPSQSVNRRFNVAG